MLDIRPVLFFNGFVLLILAGAMGLPLMVDLVSDHSEWQAFACSSAIAGFFGLALIAANQCGFVRLSTRQAFLLSASAWVSAAFFGALPFYLGSLHLTGIDGFFEAVSGITTTGATVIDHLDRMPRAVLLWRALLQWLGGVGVIVTSVTLLPVLRIGGMQLFLMETSDKTDKVKARTSEVASAVLVIYTGFTLVLTSAFLLTGMTPMEAVCHAMSSLSTGGFSTSDASLGHFSEGARWVCIAGMLVGGTTFTQYVSPWKRRGRAGGWHLFEDSQIRWYLATIAFFVLLMTLWNWAMHDIDGLEAFRQSAFNVVSVITTSGFHSGDYSAWGGFAQVAFFVMTFIGGCTGSAAGGIKIFRYEVLFAITGVQIRRFLHPHGVFVLAFNRLRLSDQVIRSVQAFVMLYFLCFVLLALLLALFGLDLLGAISGAASALANVGPGLGTMIGPGATYGGVGDEAKCLLAIGMLVGRLELATALMLFSRVFWQD